MKQNFLPQFVAIAMTKSQFCYSTGCTPYKLKQLIKSKAAKYQRLGLSKYDKMLMPNVVFELLRDTGLRINTDFYAQYVAGQRGLSSQILSE